MIEISIPKDIRKYETKVVGPFTVRQTVGLVIGLAFGGLGFAITKSMHLSSDLRTFLTMLMCAPGVLIGWIKFYAIPFEKYIQIIIRNTFLIPKKIKYKTILFDGELQKLENALEDKDSKKKKKKTEYKNKSHNPDFEKYL